MAERDFSVNLCAPIQVLLLRIFFSTHFIRVLTKYQVKDIFFKCASVNFFGNLMIKLINWIFFNSNPEQKELKKSRREIWARISISYKFFKKNDYLYLKSCREDCIV